MNRKNIVLKATLLGLTITIGGCSSMSERRVEWEYVKPEHQPVLSAVGYAAISTQPGETESLRMLRAIKASKLDAYKELAEQVYGQRVTGNQTLDNLVLQEVGLRSSVDGVIRGAEVVKSYAVGDDVYATELKLDFQKVYDLYLATARPKQVKQGFLRSLF